MSGRSNRLVGARVDPYRAEWSSGQAVQQGTGHGLNPGKQVEEAAAREVGVYGQWLSASLAIALGLMLVLLVRFNGVWFLWPLAILALGVILFGVMLAHSAIQNARRQLPVSHPVRRFTAIQEILFWMIVIGGGVALYLIMVSI